ncbi:MAG: hypothetical protein ACI4B5_02025 [Bacteroidaceae bacterium]
MSTCAWSKNTINEGIDNGPGSDVETHVGCDTLLATPTTDSTLMQLNSMLMSNGTLQQTMHKRQAFGWLKRYFKNSNKGRNKRFDWGILAGPSYNKTTSLGIGGGVSGLYSWDRTDSLLQRSNINAFFSIYVSGMYLLTLNGNNYMRHDAQRWSYKARFKRQPTDFWGIGFKNAINDDLQSSYDAMQLYFRGDYVFRVANNFYLGPQIEINNLNARDMERPDLLYGQSTEVLSTGIGAVVQYDSRDVATNASRGNYLRISQMFYPELQAGSKFMRTELTYSAYRKAWKGSVLAMEVHSLFNYGDKVPWNMLAMVGEGSHMRGYYEGRYRDKNLIESQVELRQHLWKRIGMAVFAGASNAFPDFRHIYFHQILPNAGVGFRWEFKKNVNLRIDFGLTKNKPGIEFNMNEAF